MFKEKSKLIKCTQILLFTMVIIYLLECIFIRGMFTNPLVFIFVPIFGLVAILVAIFKKEYKLMVLDIIICTICFVIFNILINL